LRFTTPEDRRVRATFGGFYSDLELAERNDFTYPGSENINLFGLNGFPDNFPHRVSTTPIRGLSRRA
jgi:iron complex outermembrane receptor protein